MRGSGEKVPDVFFITLTLFFKENMMQFYYPVLFPFRLRENFNATFYYRSCK